jgi:hypothetical protein
MSREVSLMRALYQFENGRRLLVVNPINIPWHRHRLGRNNHTPEGDPRWP